MTEQERRQISVGQVGMVVHMDGSQQRVKIVADFGPTMDVETLDETENYAFSILFDRFVKS